MEIELTTDRWELLIAQIGLPDGLVDKLRLAIVSRLYGEMITSFLEKSDFEETLRILEDGGVTFTFNREPLSLLRRNDRLILTENEEAGAASV